MAKSRADMYKKHLARAKTLNDATSTTNWTGSSAAEYPKRGGERFKDMSRKKSKNTHRTSTEVGRHELWSNAQCRTCFEDIDTTNFHELTEQIDPVKSLTDLLGDIAKIDVKNEIERNLPQKMCENCFQALTNAYSFIVQSQLVQEYLLSSLYAKDAVEISKQNIYLISTDVSSNSTQIKKEVVEENICEMSVHYHNTDVQIQTELVEEIVNQMPVDISPYGIQLKVEVGEENVCDYYNKPSTSNENNFIRKRRSTIGDGKEDMNEYESDLEKMSNIPDFHLEEDTEFEDKGFEGCANNDKSVKSRNLGARQFRSFLGGHYEVLRPEVPPNDDNTNKTNKNLPKKFGRPKKVKGGRPKTSALSRSEQLKEAAARYRQNKRKEALARYTASHPEVHREEVSRYTASHPEVGRYICTVCGKRFKKPSLLQRHQNVHSGERPFKCTECGMCFSQNPSLRRHKLHQHSGAERFQCPKCPCNFTQRSNMVIHLKERHPPELSHANVNEQIFVCSECGCVYKRNKSLARHIRIMHQHNIATANHNVVETETIIEDQKPTNLGDIFEIHETV